MLFSTLMKCDLSHAKSYFYRRANEIFGKIGRFASVSVIIKLIHSRLNASQPYSIYCLEALPLNKTQLNSLDFVINRFFTKLFCTNDIHIIRTCQDMFGFDLPSLQLDRQRKTFVSRFELKKSV